MPLHARKDVRNDLLDDLYASHDMSVVMPKYRFPACEHQAAHVFALVHDELMLDGNARMNLATFCQTWVEPEVAKLMDGCIDKNMIDKDEYPQTAEIESRCVHMLAHLWNAPDSNNTIGCSTTGSSEAAMLAGLALKWRWRQARQSAGKPADRPNLITGPVQVCWHKFARYFDVEIREIPMDPGRLLMTPDEALKRVDENTIGVVCTLGVTFTCRYEPVEAVCAALDGLQQRTGLNVPVHVDAASGGFIAPFVQPDLIWDFRLPRVKSINSSGHKYGLTPLGCGWVIWRDRSDLPEDLIFRVNYLGGDMPTFALNFSRPGGQIACQYFNFLRLGREGYRKIQQASLDSAVYFADHIVQLGPFEIVYDGRGGLPGACWKLKGGADPGFNLFDLADRLRWHGWQVPAYALPANCEEWVVQRILVRLGVSRDLLKMLLNDFRSAIDYLGNHPPQKSIRAKEGSGFRH